MHAAFPHSLRRRERILTWFRGFLPEWSRFEKLCPSSLTVSKPLDPQRLDQIRACPATRIEHHHARIGQAVGDAVILDQRAVDAPDHILNDLGGRVPDAELLAQLWIEFGEERLVEILHGLAE